MADSLFLPVLMIIGGCMFNIIATEYVLKGDPKAGNLMTLAEISMVLLQRIPSRLSTKSSFGIKPLLMPLMSHVQFTVLWSSMSVLSNFAFAYNISIPIFTLVRSCNMIATVLLGRLIFGQRYSWAQLICVAVVSCGIFLASMGEAKALKKATTVGCTGCSDAFPSAAESAPVSNDENYAAELAIWGIGIGILAFVQFVQGLLGHIQSRFYQKYSSLASKGDLVDEFMFTSHLVALLPFIFMRNDVGTAARAAFESDPIPALLPWYVPSRVVWLILTSVAQSICLKGVFQTSAIVSPLTLTIILSLRKFLSVIVSVLWFSNPWTLWHSVATVLIFGGAFAYSQAPEVDTAVDKKKD
eukprot:TRINITY_DN66973_c0_g1_i1.p1 TRINITY_DN66973_c0_g1~~TRINITY_DN66973_c0_g1_i1.p1  ORF type:complete len:356 (-),score=32.33 TRINITY_DN66973_c0_g1_i1:219-1286(-)